MATLTKTPTRKKVVARATQQPKELSKLGQWLKDHPHGLEGFEVYDKRILSGLFIFDPEYYLPE